MRLENYIISKLKNSKIIMRWFRNILIMLIQIPSGTSKIKAEADRTYLWISNRLHTHIAEEQASSTAMLCS